MILFLLGKHSGFAQFDTEYLMPPVWESRMGGDTDSMQLVITTAYPTANVIVRQSNGTIIQRGTASSGNPLKVRLSTELGMTYEANQVESSKGLLITADYPVQVVYRNISHNNQCLIPLKGRFGLGTVFYTGTQTRVQETGYGEDDLHFISVMATENNTSVTIEAPPGVLFSTNTRTITCSLNQHETYLVRNKQGTNASNNLAGARVSADKPVAVVSGGQHLKYGGRGGHNADAGIDQLVPVTSDFFDVIGTQYIVVRGGTRQIGEVSTDYAIVVGAYDSTDIYIDGHPTPVATIHEGESYEYILPGGRLELGTPHYIETSKKAVVYHVSGLREHEMGLSILPTLYCSGSTYLEFKRFENNENYINVIAPEAAFATPTALTINDQPYTVYDATPSTVPGNIGWKTITFAYDTNPIVTPSIQIKSDYYFHLGILVGGNPAGAYGYLSGFSAKVDVLDPVVRLPTTHYLAGIVEAGGTLDHCLLLRSCNNTFQITNLHPGANTGSVTSLGDPGQPQDTCIRYVAQPGFVGYDTVRVEVADGNGNPGWADLVFLVGAMPVAHDDETVVSDDRGARGNVLDNDQAEVGEVPVLNTVPAHGTVVFHETGDYHYTPNSHFSGTDQFTYYLCDNEVPSYCDSATVTLHVPGEPETPTDPLSPSPADIIIVYQGFSPDGDGINDRWEIGNIDRFPGNTVRIFNRWGNKIYETRGYNNSDRVWAGESSIRWTIQSKEAPDGTYFYIIDLGDGQKPLTGYITIHR